MGHRFQLEKYKGMKSRFRCPQCDNRQKSFTRYIDTCTGEYVSEAVGKCSRESNCGYHYTPKQYFQDNPNGQNTLTNPNIFHARARTVAEIPDSIPSLIPYSVFESSLKEYESNCFIQFLNQMFGGEITQQAIDRYFIGSCKHWPGGTVFWQIDLDGYIRSGKVMLFNSSTGNRVKEPYVHINWVHALKDNQGKKIYPGYNLKQCFYGEHLLHLDQVKPVAIVESEKTAIIASIYLPQFIWLACGSMNGISPEKLLVLSDRNVILYPDLKCFDRWNEIAIRLPNVQISNLLETRATEYEKAKGLDLADYLLRFDYRDFLHQNDSPNNRAYKQRSQKTLTNQYIFETLESTPDPITKRAVSFNCNCFEGHTGKVYVQNPTALDRYAVYSSIDCYNKRSEKPEYIGAPIAMQDFFKERFIDISCLMIK